MAAKPIAMDRLKEVLKLYQQGHSIKAIVRLTGLSRNTVRSYVARGADASTDQMASDADLAAILYNQDLPSLKSERYQQLVLHFEKIDRELAQPGVTRQLLWREYLEQYPDGYAYSQYCYYLQRFFKHKDVVMHLEYAAGEQLMVDFAGKKYFYVDQETGERIACEVFVACLPYSGLIFCMAVRSQKTLDVLDAINQLLRYVGGVTQTVLCDNFRTVVTRSDKYEPVFTDLCLQLSEHYSTTFSATRPGKPRDKAMVEKAVNLVYQQVYAPLRNQIFHSIEAVNHAFRIKIDQLNIRPYKGSSFSRRDLFNQHEQPLLGSLPTAFCQLKKSTVLTVQRNYHIQLTEDRLYYSVPFAYVGKKVKIWYDQRTIEVYYEHQRIAVHPRSRHGQAYTTLGDHMPVSHQQAKAAKGWNREELLQKAARIGLQTGQVAEKILGTSIYMEQNYKSCFGMLMLEKRYGSQRLEAACNLAISGTRVNYTMIKNILAASMDKQVRMPEVQRLPQHENIRGAQQYQ